MQFTIPSVLLTIVQIAPVVEPFGFRRHYQQPQVAAPSVTVTSPKSNMLPTIIVGGLAIAVLAVMFMLIRRK